jgi:hypothetical protein
MKKWVFLLAIPFILGSCKARKKPLTDSEVVDVKDFIAFFDESRLPFQIGDSTLQAEESDSLAISYKVFSRFVRDTLLAKAFGKKHHPEIFPLGKISVKDGETYLFVKAVNSDRQMAYILAFDPKNKFQAGMPVLQALEGNPTHTTVTMDSRYTLTTFTQHKKPDGSPYYRKEAYVFNNAGMFMLILTESNDVTSVRNRLINPIDTLPRKNRLAGDYIRDKNNLVSVRDGRSSSQLLVFIHFETDDGGCKGELKGYAKLVNPNKAVYHEQGDPCVLEMLFSGNRVSLKEEGCGAHRDIKCFFEGSFTRKTPLKPSPLKKRSKSPRAA